MRRVLTTLALVTSVLSAQTSSALAPQFAHVDFVRPMPGKSAEYSVALRDKVLPVHQERVRQGAEVAFLNYARQFPHGSGLAAQSMRIMLTNQAGGAAEPQTSNAGIPRGLFTTVNGELWQLLDSIDMPRFLRSKYIRVIFGKTLPGKREDFQRFLKDTYKPWLEEGAKEGRFNAAVFFRTLFPGGQSAEYDLVVMYAYDDVAKAVPAVPAGGPTNPRVRVNNEALNNLRTIVRHELWQ